MRQPGQDFNIDPFQPIKLDEVEAPVLPPTFMKDHERWLHNTALTKSYKFCGGLCINFKTGSSIAANEEACMKTCINKYQSAYTSFQKEKTLFL